MSIFQPEFIYQPVPFHVCSLGRYSSAVWGLAVLGDGDRLTGGWTANNLAIYVPVSMPTPFTIARFMIANGSNITGNVDVGIYSAAGTRLLSTGSTARANASAVQYLDVTNMVFQRGNYYLGMVGSSTTGTYLQVTVANAVRGRVLGVLEEQLGATTLPGTMTPVALTGTSLPQFGFTQSDTL